MIIDKDIVFIFTENPEEDLIKMKKAYEEDEEFEFPLGYKTPELTDYTFLGNKYQCISLWFDNEDVPVPEFFDKKF